jgi:hypothetical protein
MNKSKRISLIQLDMDDKDVSYNFMCTFEMLEYERFSLEMKRKRIESKS